MFVAANKWLGIHLLISVLMRMRGALRWSHKRSSDLVSSCLVTTCLRCIMFPCIDDVVNSQGALFGECSICWDNPLGEWFSLLCMFYVAGDTMGKPWLPHCYIPLHVEEVTWRNWGGIHGWFSWWCILGHSRRPQHFSPKMKATPCILQTERRTPCDESTKLSIQPHYIAGSGARFPFDDSMDEEITNRIIFSHACHHSYLEEAIV